MSTRRKKSQGFPNIGALLKDHFFSGLLVFIPLWVIGWILSGIWDRIWSLQTLVPGPLRPESFISDPRLVMLITVAISLGILTVMALAISLLGWISGRYLGRKFFDWLGEVIQHIPVIRSIYSALDQLLRTFTGGAGAQQFSRVVYVEWPRKGVWTLAFVTGAHKSPALPHGHLNLFVPATPNPTSGFYVIVAEGEVKESGLSVEEAFKVILSLGIADGSK